MAGRKGLKILLVTVTAIVIILAASVLVLVKYGNRIIKSELERRLGKSFSIEKVYLKWGHVEASGIRLRSKEGKEVVKVESLTAKADFMQLLRKEYVISKLTIKEPYVCVETDHKGELVSPVLPAGSEPAPPAPAKKEGPQAGPAAPLTIKELSIENGSIDYLDGKSAKTPVLTKVRQINLGIKDVRVPFSDGFTTYTLEARLPGNHGTGVIRSQGKIRLKTTDMEGKGEVRGLDITNFKPYFQKNTNVNITRGFVDVDIQAKIVSRRLSAPGRAVIKDLEFRSLPGAKNQFMGVPLSLVVAFLKRSGNQIPVNFTLEGDLDNPRVSLRESFMNRLSEGMAGNLGLSIKGMGQSMATMGAEGAKGVGSGIEGIRKGLKNLFK